MIFKVLKLCKRHFPLYQELLSFKIFIDQVILPMQLIIILDGSIRDILQTKKMCYFFLMSVQNIDFGHSFVGITLSFLMNTDNLCFEQKNRKIMYTHVNQSFLYINWKILVVNYMDLSLWYTACCHTRKCDKVFCTVHKQKQCLAT